MMLQYRMLHSQTRLSVTGPDQKRFLHGMVTNDILSLQPGSGCHAVMLTVKGKMLTDLVVYQKKDSLFLVMPGSVGEKIKEALERHLIMDDAVITDQSAVIGQLGIYGEQASSVLSQLLSLPISALETLPPYHEIETAPGETVLIQNSGEKAADSPQTLWVAKAPDLGIVGYHVFAPFPILTSLQSQWMHLGMTEMTEEEAKLLRIEAGIPLYGVDMDEERLPLEANLQDAISFTKGCYLGQEVIVRVTSRGHINRKLMGLHFPQGELPPLGSNLIHETKDHAGTVMSSIHSPYFGSIALGYVHRNFWEVGTQLYVAARESVVSPALPVAVVCDLPFGSKDEKIFLYRRI